MYARLPALNAACSSDASNGVKRPLLKPASATADPCLSQPRIMTRRRRAASGKRVRLSALSMGSPASSIAPSCRNSSALICNFNGEREERNIVRRVGARPEKRSGSILAASTKPQNDGPEMGPLLFREASISSHQGAFVRERKQSLGIDLSPGQPWHGGQEQDARGNQEARQD